MREMRKLLWLISICWVVLTASALLLAQQSYKAMRPQHEPGMQKLIDAVPQLPERTVEIVLTSDQATSLKKASIASGQTEDQILERVLRQGLNQIALQYPSPELRKRLDAADEANAKAVPNAVRR